MKVLDQAITDRYAIYNADCIEVAKGLPSNTIDYTIFSPPFASLYTFSNSDRDMSNCSSYDDFFAHFKFLVSDMYRITRPGRLLSFHCTNLAATKNTNGYMGLIDFRGHLINLFQECGWIYHSEVVIWKDPVVAMQRTKALGLLHKTIRKDSAMSRQGIPDYLVTMRKPGDNEKPIQHYRDEKECVENDGDETKIFPVELWSRYASPVWMDIKASDTLQFREARDSDDERHITPTQLGVIERAIHLWTAKDDLVFSPFLGIGSEGYMSVKMGRRFIGSELKPSYFKVAVDNLKNASTKQLSLFEEEENVI